MSASDSSLGDCHAIAARYPTDMEVGDVVKIALYWRGCWRTEWVPTAQPPDDDLLERVLAAAWRCLEWHENREPRDPAQ